MHNKALFGTISLPLEEGFSITKTMTEEQKTAKKDVQTGSPLLDEMFSVGAHLGYTRSKRHASVAGFIFGKKDNLDIIDLRKTDVSLKDAETFMKGFAEHGKVVLFVGTKPEIRNVVRAAAEEAGMPYVSERWIGGLMTNFQEIKKRLARLQEIKEQKEKDGLEVYTKKERAKIEKEFEDLNRNFSGVAELIKIPDALFVVDPRNEEAAILEAEKVGIPVVALCGSDCDIRKITHPIIANDSSQKSVSFFVNFLKDAYKSAAPKN